MKLDTEAALGKAQQSERFQAHIGAMNAQSTLGAKSNASGMQLRRELTIVDYQNLVRSLRKSLQSKNEIIETLLQKEQQVSRRCRIQRKLLDHFREQLDTQQVEVDALQDLIKRNQRSVQAEPVREQSRVVSLDTALLRINGVDVSKSVAEPTAEWLEEIDMDEFQPVEDLQERNFLSQVLEGMSQKMNQRISAIRQYLNAENLHSVMAKANQTIVRWVSQVRLMLSTLWEKFPIAQSLKDR